MSLDLESVLKGLRGRPLESRGKPQGLPDSTPVAPVRLKDLVLSLGEGGTIAAVAAADCAACEGGYVFVTDENGYSFARRCQCQVVREAADRITRACIPAAYVNATALKYRPWQMETARFIRDHYTGSQRPSKGMILHGQGVGTGKSTLAALALQYCAMRGMSARWIGWDALHLRLAEVQRAAFGKETEEGDRSRADVIREMAGVSVLVIDDVKDAGEAGVKIAEEIIGARWNASTPEAQRFTIITTNLGTAGLQAAMGPRAMSRILGSATPFEIVGPDVRQIAP